MNHGKYLIDVNRVRGFSIVELMIVVTMLGIITSIAIPQLSGVLSNSKEVLVKDFSETLNKAVKKHSQLNYDIKLEADDSLVFYIFCIGCFWLLCSFFSCSIYILCIKMWKNI